MEFNSMLNIALKTTLELKLLSTIVLHKMGNFFNFSFFSQMSYHQTFILDGEIIKYSFQYKVHLQHLVIIKEEIGSLLLNDEPYYVKSKVNPENFKSFLKYWYDKENPEITSDNIYDYFQLSQEFGIMEDLITNSQEAPAIHLLCLKCFDQTQTGQFSDNFIHEEYIAKHLDEIIRNHSNLLQQVPISSLYNIFNHKARQVNQIRAYNFILNSIEKVPNIFILLETLDCPSLSNEIVKECISNKDEHFGFIPNNILGFIENLIDENSELKEQLNLRKLYCHQFFLNDDTDKGIIAFLASNSEKYDPYFVVSLSSNDMYSVICPIKNENSDVKLYDGFRSNTNSKYWGDEPRNSSFTIELQKPQLVSSIKFYGPNKNNYGPIVEAFSYTINNNEEKNVSVEEIFQDDDVSKRVVTVEINPPIDIKQIKIMPKNSDKEKEMTWPIFGGLELFYDNKPVFESLIQKSKYKDPHKCGVYIDATYNLQVFFTIYKKNFQKVCMLQLSTLKIQ